MSLKATARLQRRRILQVLPFGVPVGLILASSRRRRMKHRPTGFAKLARVANTPEK